MPSVTRRSSAPLPLAVSLVTVVMAAPIVSAQQTPLDRLPPATLDVRPPSARVGGEPGRMTARPLPCQSPAPAGIRRRIVEIAVQEWGFFGFSILDQTERDEDEFEPWRGRRGRNRADAPRVAASIAGYWMVTPEGGWILGNQNAAWNGPDGAEARWRSPWSAAFISWVMCEAGLGDAGQFQRAVAHHVYIDQAIRARGVTGARAAYAAYEAGEVAVAPGDLLCTARRPEYQTLAERRRQLGQGARTHCDIVVKVDAPARRILAIGGNVRGSVSLKVLPATPTATGLRPARATEAPGGRNIFAHLSLRPGPVQLEAFDQSPTLRAVGCGTARAITAQPALARVIAPDRLVCAD
jgi:hypothetical protein